jgi:XRE family transcriptional regulator, aerobic/anaerobic benzoate catabolism transcriptional regulator
MDGWPSPNQRAVHLFVEQSRTVCIILQRGKRKDRMRANHIDAKAAAPGDSRVVLAREDDFLLLLGKRVRQTRSQRGMTRKMVARDADVSERHLAQLESGEGNVSIVLLRRIAAALSVTLVDLFAPEVDEPAEKRLIQRFLERVPAHRLQDVVFRLKRDFTEEEDARRSRIALIGLRGAGKSTLGSQLARETNTPFIELDMEIEKDTGMPLAEIFSLYGQSGYRAIEKRTLERVLREHDRAVLSVGGGVVSEKETYDYLLSHCYTIWIKAQPEEHMSRVIAQGDFRVIAGNDRAMEDLRRILEAREPLYRKADMSLDTSGDSPEQSFGKLRLALQQNIQ